MVEDTQGIPVCSLLKSDREAVLAVISSKQMLSIEELLRALPWIRWGELFSIVGLCMKEGVIVLEQRGMEFEVRMNELRGAQADDAVQASFGLKHKHFSQSCRPN